MSTSNQSGAPAVPAHAVLRFQQRANEPRATQASVKTAWRDGEEVEVSDKNYTEARYVSHNGVEVILLRQGDHIPTIILAEYEEIEHDTEVADEDCDCSHIPDSVISGYHECPECGARTGDATGDDQ